MKNVTILEYQLEFPLTKEMCEEYPYLYKIALIYIRLNELREKGSYMHKANKPNKKGTKITFKTVKNADEYEKEFEKIIEDRKKLMSV